MRTLAWNGNTLYASRGYEVYSAVITDRSVHWQHVAGYRPEWWRKWTCRNRLSFRLVRDGFHALANLPDGTLIAALPGRIARLQPGETEFITTHRVTRGTRPLHITVIPSGSVFWGEYFDNPNRDEVHIYSSEDWGTTWHVVHTFAKGSIRHVHNIVYDKWSDCLWVFTGDYGRECRILRASPDFTTLDEVVSGNQQARAVAAIATAEGLYFASDSPLEQNYIYHLDRWGAVHRLVALPSSSIYTCRNRAGMFFSTMAEHSEVNTKQRVTLYSTRGGESWNQFAEWRKDRWPMTLFQYGNIILPDGENTSQFVAATTVAVEGADLQMSIWQFSA
jgi:hypothetical protein